jgi:hypothetical protein
MRISPGITSANSISVDRSRTFHGCPLSSSFQRIDASVT